MTELRDLVSPEFRRLVARELADARVRAYELMPVRVHLHRGVTGRRYRRSNDGTCVACGISLDECTPGCLNCRSRAYMRARKAAA